MEPIDNAPEIEATPAARPARVEWATILYAMLPVLLFAVQLHFSITTMTQLRPEEGSESIRAVLWFDMHKLFDGISSNVGYYAILLVVYKIFGFTLYTARYVRAALQLISLICAAEALRRMMGKRRAIVPLIAFGLSPTIIYFNAIQNEYGIDLQYFSIIVLLIMVQTFRASAGSYAKSLLLGAVTMLAWMSFPTVLFYLPVFGAGVLIMYLRERSGHPIRGAVLPGHIACMAIGFAIPFIAALLWMEKPMLLLNDPMCHSGIFRGGGKGGFITDLGAFAYGAAFTLRDLFVSGQSYLYEVASGEFSKWYARLGFAFVVIASTWAAIRDRRMRILVGLCWVLIAVNFFVPLIANGPPGLRRSTGVIAGFYVLFAIAWQRLDYARPAAKLGALLCLLIPLHSALAYPGNLELTIRGRDNYDVLWFMYGATPDETLKTLLKMTEQGQFVTVIKNGEPSDFPYIRIFCVLEGYRRWNHLPQVPIYVIDPKTRRPIRLEPKIWDDYYWKHAL